MFYYQKSEESGSEDLEDRDELDDVPPDIEEENVPLEDEGRQRLGVVNMDWRFIRAVDLYVLPGSSLSTGGRILSVSVYPSEFVLRRMKEEEVRGPGGLFDGGNEKNPEGDDDGDDDEEFDYQKVRDYEKSRLRYYYAVVECNSVSTAQHIYKTCDGVEFERSPNVLDLRFIPDSMEFKHPPRDVVTEAPAKYEGPDFNAKAPSA